MGAVPSIADLLERVPSWVGRAVEWQRLEGGLSHHVFRIDVDQRPYVLRVPEPAVSAVGLGIPPEQEIANTIRAADTVGAQVYTVLDDVPAIVLEFLPGRTLSRTQVRRPELVPALAEWTLTTRRRQPTNGARRGTRWTTPASAASSTR